MIRPQFTLRSVLFSVAYMSACLACFRLASTIFFVDIDGVGVALRWIGVALFGAGIGVFFGKAGLGAIIAPICFIPVACLLSPPV